MFSSMKLSTKLIAGFAVVAVITAIVGFTGVISVGRIDSHLEEVAAVRTPSIVGLAQMGEGLASRGGALRTILISELEPAQRATQIGNLTKSKERYDAGRAIYEPLPQTPEEALLWQDYVKAYEADKVEYDKFILSLNKFLGSKIDMPMELKWNIKSRMVEHLKWVEQLNDAVREGRPFQGQLDPTQCNFGKWYYSYKTESPALQAALKEIEAPHRHLHELGGEIVKLSAAGNRGAASAKISDVRKEEAVVLEMMEKIHTVVNETDELLESMQDQALGPLRERYEAQRDVLNKIMDLNIKIAEDERVTADTEGAVLNTLMIGASLIGILLALGLGVWLARAISRPIMTIVTDLTSGAEQVAAASGEISTASQSLAEGATEQASSLEETSAALEEMSSQTRQNADNAAEANNLASATRKAAENGSEVMGKMIAAMTAINTSSEKISKIIKVIEEIAFQTNLLALNAAVEAARAGEHGKGFAVVAEEVRNLAQRSATAAKDTSALIEESVKRVTEGNEMAQASGEALSRIVESVKKVTDLVGEISVASHEQAQGVDQINTAVTQMDKVTQQNASNAEESAAASEELSAQAEKLNDVVADLTRIVEGAGAVVRHGAAHTGGAGLRKGPPKLLKGPAPRKAAAHAGKPAPKHEAPAKPEGGEKPRKKAEDVIPLDEDFGDF